MEPSVSKHSGPMEIVLDNRPYEQNNSCNLEPETSQPRYSQLGYYAFQNRINSSSSSNLSDNNNDQSMGLEYSSENRNSSSSNSSSNCSDFHSDNNIEESYNYSSSNTHMDSQFYDYENSEQDLSDFLNLSDI